MFLRALYMRQSSGRWRLGSQRCCAERNENTRSLARDFSSSRRAPPKAASKPYLSSACFSPCVFMTSVWTAEPCVNGPMPRARPSWLMCTQQLQAELRGHLIAERDHFPEFPGRVDVQQRERRLRRVERLHREVQHHRAVLADGVEHDRPLALGDDLAQDVDAFGFEPLQVSEYGHCSRIRRARRVPACGRKRWSDCA